MFTGMQRVLDEQAQQHMIRHLTRYAHTTAVQHAPSAAGHWHIAD